MKRGNVSLKCVFVRHMKPCSNKQGIWQLEKINILSDNIGYEIIAFLTGTGSNDKNAIFIFLQEHCGIIRMTIKIKRDLF